MSTQEQGRPGLRPDMIRIDVDDAADVRTWAERFNCSRAELVEALDQTGPVAADVHLFLSHRLPQVPDFIDPAVFRTKAGGRL